MEAFRIIGGKPLVGTVRVCAAKNAVLPILAACMLLHEPVTLNGCPYLSDVENMLSLLCALGCRTRREGKTIQIDPKGADGCVMPEALSSALRSSIFMLGPVLARNGMADFAYPGGCEIGARPIDLHLQGLRKLGAHIEEKHGRIRCEGKLRGAHIHLDYPSVGATENILMAALCAEGTTVLSNAAREPEVNDLANFLRTCGGRIEGVGTGTLTIHNSVLHGCTYAPVPDRITAGTLLIGAAMTGGRVTVADAVPEHLLALTEKLKEAGCQVLCDESGVTASRTGKLLPISRLETAPFPGFPTDLQAPMTALLTQAVGTSLMQEKVFENRMLHVPELKKLGADITVQGNSAIVSGGRPLYGAEVTAKDLRAGAALCLAGLCAQGETIVKNVRLIDRGYARFEEILKSLGTDIERIERND